MSKTFSVLIVGCGKIAGRFGAGSSHLQISHAQAITKSNAFELLGAVDPDATAREIFSTYWEVNETFESLTEALSVRTWDVVVIASPDVCHFDDLNECAAGNSVKLIVVEKPICTTREELEKLKMIQTINVPVVVNHTRRFDHGHQQTARMVASGALGAFVEGWATYYGGWCHSGVHIVDTLRMLFGDPITVQYAGPGIAERKDDPTLDVDIKVNGGVVRLRAFPENNFQLFETDLRFCVGRIQFLDFGERIVVDKIVTNQKGERIPELFKCIESSSSGDAMSELYHLASQYLNSGDLTVFSYAGLDEARKTMDLVLNVYGGQQSV